MKYKPQVDRSHYTEKGYRSQDRWNAYFHQINLVQKMQPETLLEVGVGEGLVARELKERGIHVTTVDIASDLHPDIVGSVTELPFRDAQFDVVLAAEILEHIRFEDVPQALSEIARVTKRAAVISLPHPGYVFSWTCKIPLFPRMSIFFQIPFFWKTHVFNGEHYWELGKRRYPIRRFVDLARNAGLYVQVIEKHVDDPAHRFFLFSRKTV